MHSVVQSFDNQGHSLLKRNDHYGSDSIELDPFQIARIRILDPSESLFQFEDPERCFHSHLRIFAISEYFLFHFSMICLTSASGGQPMQLYYMKRDGIPLPEGTAVLMAVATAYKFVLVTKLYSRF